MTDIADISELIEIETQIAALEERRQAFIEAGNPKDILVARLMPIFDTWPQVHSVGWIQYTPFWNDGDPCEFSVIGPVPNVKPLDQWDDDDYEDAYDVFDRWSFKYAFVNRDADDDDKARYGEFTKQQAEDLDKQLAAIETWLDMNHRLVDRLFGHSKIVVQRNGSVTTEEFDHD